MRSHCLCFGWVWRTTQHQVKTCYVFVFDFTIGVWNQDQHCNSFPDEGIAIKNVYQKERVWVLSQPAATLLLTSYLSCGGFSCTLKTAPWLSQISNSIWYFLLSLAFPCLLYISQQLLGCVAFRDSTEIRSETRQQKQNLDITQIVNLKNHSTPTTQQHSGYLCVNLLLSRHGIIVVMWDWRWWTFCLYL